jgi:adenylate cyclase class 2
VRRDGDVGIFTWKGPALEGPVKTREEVETAVDRVDALVAILAALGYAPRFRSQKYRAEYAVDGALVTVDETPFGTFVEIEAAPEIIAAVTATLGRSAADHVLESYPALWRQWCQRRGRPFGDMLFS